MKRILTTILAALAISGAACGQTAEKLLASMPDSIIPVMTKTNRLDCIDFYKSKMKASVDNAYGGKSQLLELTDSYARLQPTASSGVQMHTYKSAGGSTVVALVYTYAAPSRESELAFYDAKWQPLAAALITPPAHDKLTMRPDTASAAHAAKAMATLSDAYVCASIDAASGDISFCLSTDGLTLEEKEAVKAYVAPAATYRWNGRRFERK